MWDTFLITLFFGGLHPVIPGGEMLCFAGNCCHWLEACPCGGAGGAPSGSNNTVMRPDSPREDAPPSSISRDTYKTYSHRDRCVTVNKFKGCHLLTFNEISDNHGRLHPQLAQMGAVLPYHLFGYNQKEN